jgi:excisionase family DNA binding protein
MAPVRCLGIGEVARRLGVSQTTVRRVIERGELAAFQTRERGSWRVREDALEQAMRDWTSIAREHLGLTEEESA